MVEVTYFVVIELRTCVFGDSLSPRVFLMVFHCSD